MNQITLKPCKKTLKMTIKNSSRNFSFRGSKRLPEDKMTVINDVSIPAIPGSCYHAILCGLIDNKNKFVFWTRLEKLVEKYIVTYGGEEAWNKFVKRGKKTKFSEWIFKK